MSNFTPGDKMSKNSWEFIPDFSSMWKNNNNYGQTIHIEGIYASVSPYTASVRKRATDTCYVAIVTGFGLPQIRKDTFSSASEAKAWCESWLCFLYRRIQLEKQVECYDSWLKYYQEELTKVQDQIHEQKWEEIQQHFRETFGDNKQVDSEDEA